MAPKSLSRLSRQSLISVALNWLDNPVLFQQPYLASNRGAFEAADEDYLYTPAEDVESLREIYRSLQKDVKTGSKREIIDRIIEGDWRRGLSLHQWALIDLKHLEDHDTALRWTALRLAPLKDQEDADDGPPKKKRRLDPEPSFPRVEPATFLESLKREISPLVKAHYYLHRLPAPQNLTVLRLYITNQPHTKTQTLMKSSQPDAVRTIYLALPDSCPYVYVAVSGTGASRSKAASSVKLDMAAMKRTILEAIPKAMSRPQERYALENTDVTVRSLRALCNLKGNSGRGDAGGIFNAFAEDVVDNSPLDVLDAREKQQEANINPRFGPQENHTAVDRMHVKFKDLRNPGAMSSTKLLPSPSAVPVNLTFTGSDIFAGLRKLVELGDFVDRDQMPGWMTGESGVTSLTL